jgi:hypothetical protein
MAPALVGQTHPFFLSKGSCRLQLPHHRLPLTRQPRLGGQRLTHTTLEVGLLRRGGGVDGRHLDPMNPVHQWNSLLDNLVGMFLGVMYPMVRYRHMQVIIKVTVEASNLTHTA